MKTPMKATGEVSGLLEMKTTANLSDNETGIAPADFLRTLRERFVVILVTVILAVGAAVVFSLWQTPMYRASAEVLRQTAALDQTLFGTSVFRFQDAQRELQTGANLVKIKSVGRMVKDDLRSERDVEELLKMVEVTPVGSTDVIRITAVSSDPAEAADVANSFAVQFIKSRQEANRSILAAADKQVLAELEQMSPEERASERAATLTQKHEELGILQSMQTGGFELVQGAEAPVVSFSPRPVRNAGFAFLGGIFLGTLLAFLLNYLDRRIKDERNLEREFSLPVLASVPREGGRWGSDSPRRSKSLIGFSKSQWLRLEAFRSLRSNLRFYQIGSKSQTLLFTSALPQEGKTVTAINLGLTLALSGARVILLEADLRRPSFHRYLNMDKSVGMSTVLVGASTFQESLQVVRVADYVPDPGLNGATADLREADLKKDLLCMTSGPLPPNPAELLGSPRMQELISTAAAHAEYVLIDGPPLLLVSDALNIAGQVDGIIITTRLKSTTIDEARDVRAVLERSGGRALGLVANGVSSKSKSYYRGQYKDYGIST